MSLESGEDAIVHDGTHLVRPSFVDELEAILSIDISSDRLEILSLDCQTIGPVNDVGRVCLYASSYGGQQGRGEIVEQHCIWTLTRQIDDEASIC